ncbi:hypothetical protein LUZ60_001961 [Juncus effusus]|nr:hypothetical protein LUZ60_001961 [Juncus effusus]
MKQEEREWMKYENVTKEVIRRSGLPERIFFDLRGNHDSFGVPVPGGANDFYAKYSINSRLNRTGTAQSVTLQTRERKHLFVGIDTTTSGIGLKGPTNLFGHPTDQLLSNLDKSLSQFENSNSNPVTKIAFGHFPISFTAPTETGRTLKDIFLKNYLSVYLNGHLHTKFGKNLKRHHVPNSNKYFQTNIHENNNDEINETESCKNNKRREIKEFWEWEMGDWRKSRNLRILGIDSGHVSYTDIDYKYGSRDIIIHQTFPLDSRFMQRISNRYNFKCKDTLKSLETIRALVFSKHEIISVWAKVYDSKSGIFNVVLDSEMKKYKENENLKKRGNLYFVPWNFRAFIDPNPDRYWIKIEARDITGESFSTSLKPFSINGLSYKINWSWIEFIVMGFQWATMYNPILWSLFIINFALIIFPKLLLILFKYQNFRGRNCTEYLFCFFTEFPKMSALWSVMLIYLVYLLFCPWFYGYAINETDLMYMTYKGWTGTDFTGMSGFPDIMVIVLLHLFLVVLFTILVMFGFAAERRVYKVHFLSLTGKKEDDSRERKSGGERKLGRVWTGRWIRKFLILVSVIICWRHFKQCRALVKAYDMNPFIHAPIYCFMIPTLLVFCIYKTSSI